MQCASIQLAASSICFAIGSASPLPRSCDWLFRHQIAMFGVPPPLLRQPTGVHNFSLAAAGEETSWIFKGTKKILECDFFDPGSVFWDLLALINWEIFQKSNFVKQLFYAFSYQIIQLGLNNTCLLLFLAFQAVVLTLTFGII